MQKNQTISQKSQVHDWITIHLASPESFHGGGSVSAYARNVLMGHYLIMMIEARYSKSKQRLCVVNLRDTTYQEEVLEKSFLVTKGFSFTKYGENQIIMFGGEIYEKITNQMILITIESFSPMKIKFEEIKNEDAPFLSEHSAEIYQDRLFIFGGRSEGKTALPKKLWCFDIKEKTWKECKKTGKAPEGRLDAGSWIKEDHLYIYGGYLGISKTKTDLKTLFALNLKSMQWRKIEQTDLKPGQDPKDIGQSSKLDVNVYGDNILVLKREPSSAYKLYCCNRHTLDSWSNIEIKNFGDKILGNSVVYKDALYSCSTGYIKEDKIELSVLPLDKVGLAPSRSAEDEYLSSLFLNQNESDIQFKIQDKIIPAHKKILIQKSQFFSNLFNSGMIESKLHVIDIDDCELDVFKEFLRFLYCGQVNKDFPKMKELFLLADKYVQEDLCCECEAIFIHNITQQTISDTLQFAREHEIDHLKNWCLKVLEDYLESSHRVCLEVLQPYFLDSYKLANAQKREEVVDFLLGNLPEIVEKAESDPYWEPFEKVLIEEISTERIAKYTDLFYEGTPFGKPPSPMFLNEMANLRDALFKFVFKNSKSLEKQGLYKQLSSCFISEFEKYKSRIQEEKDSILEKLEAESLNENTKRAQRKTTKRMDPANVALSNEGPVLKKIK